MQKIYKVIISLIVVCIVTVTIPFYVSAENSYVTGTYFYEEPASFNNLPRYSGYDYLNVQGIDRIVLGNQAAHYTSNYETRGVIVKSGNDTYFVSVSLDGSPFYIRSCYAWLNNTIYTVFNNTTQSGYASRIYNNTTYYYKTALIQNSDLLNSITEAYTDESIDYRDLAYEYTYGSHQDSGPVYGDLTVGFHTNFSASGTSENYQIIQNTNLDTIEWKRTDSLGNNLADKGANVEIRAVPVLFSDPDRNTFLAQTIQDAVINYNDALILWQGNFNDYHKSFLWKDVIYQLEHSSAVFFISAMFTGGVWKKYGWIYQIRYNIVLEGFTSEWQTIYNSTSISVDDGEHILNTYYYNYPSGLNPDDKEIFQTVNNYNNTENNTWYVNDVPIDTSSDVSWLETLVQAITELIGKILDFFKGIFDGLVDLILGLFDNINPADSFFNWFSDLFNGIGDIDLTLPQFNIPSADLSSFNRLVQETMDIFSLNNFGFVIFIPLLLIIIKAVF